MEGKIFFLILFLSYSVWGQQDNARTTTLGKGIINHTSHDNLWSIQMNARMQLLSQFETSSQFKTFESSALLRRARFRLKGFLYSPKIRYKLELGFSNHDMRGGSSANHQTPLIIYDALVIWEFAKNFEFWFGQAKLPGNIERVISSGSLQFVDRSALNSEFNIDREFGLWLRHQSNLTDTFLMREKIAISQGEGRNITIQNSGGYQLTSRLEFLPFGKFKDNGAFFGSDLSREKKLKTLIGIGFSLNKGATKERGSQGNYFLNLDPVKDRRALELLETDATTFFVDATLKYQGFSFLGEYAQREATDKTLIRTGSGLNLSAGYMPNHKWEVSTRMASISLDEYQTDNRKEYTLGFSRYFVGHRFKVQSDFSYMDFSHQKDQLVFRVQVEMHL
jgi:phosphate-selective porin OprO/OprP